VLSRREESDGSVPAEVEERFEDILVQDHVRDRGSLVRKRLFLWGPAMVAVAILLSVGVFRDWSALGSLVITVVTTFFAAGKFIILTGAADLTEFGPWELALMVFAMDVITASLLAFNLDVFYRIPQMGPSLRRLQDYGRYTLRKKPWLRRLSFVGIVFFVLFPVAATGAVGGSILGRLLGMRPYRLVLAIATGSLLGCATMAAGAHTIRDAADSMQHDPWFRAAGFAVIVLLVALLWMRYRSIQREMESLRADDKTG
jgi:uncharacterized membrane protein